MHLQLLLYDAAGNFISGGLLGNEMINPLAQIAKYVQRL
jgi:hypothetical protein